MNQQPNNHDPDSQVIEVFERHLGLSGIALSPARLLADLGVNSLTLVTVLFDLEELFGFDLLAAEVQLAELRTLADVIELVKDLQARQ